MYLAMVGVLLTSIGIRGAHVVFIDSRSLKARNTLVPLVSKGIELQRASIRYANVSIWPRRADLFCQKDRPIFEIKKKGRPPSQCQKCRDLRKYKDSHVKCSCNDKSASAEGMMS